MITRTDHNQTFDQNGNLIAEEVVEVDITVEVVTLDLHGKLRQFKADIRAILDDHATEIDGIVAAITEQQANRDTANTDIATQQAARDAAQVILDDPASTANQKRDANTAKQDAILGIAIARLAKSHAVDTLEMLRRDRNLMADTARGFRATNALLRLVIGSDLLTDVEDT